jgi:peptidoglycan/LPS O-acetylase OafA/YrhL
VDRTTRIAFLEGVRGVAAGVVVLQHLLAGEFPGYRDWSRHHLDLGRVGVVAFFLVSGYVIPLSLSGQTLRTFAVRRFFRLYPVYWVALPLYALVHVDPIGARVTVPLVVLNAAMAQGLVGAVSILPPAWTLSIELIFYAQSAAAKARRLLDAAVHAGWAWLALYLALCAAERVTGVDMPTTLPMLLYVASVGHALHRRDASGSRTWVPLLAAGAVAVPAGAYVGVDGSGEWPPLTYGVSFLAGIALFAAFYAWRGRSFGRPLIVLGAISYAVYLFHPIVHDVLRGVLGVPRGIAFVAADLVAVAVVAWLVHRFLESPSIRFGRRLTARRRGVAEDTAGEVAAP